MQLILLISLFLPLPFFFYSRQESVDLLLGINRPVVDEDGNILGDFFQEPLDLDLWATRPAQLQQLQQGQQQNGGGEGPSVAQATAAGTRGGGGGAGVGTGAANVLASPAALQYLQRSCSRREAAETTTAPNAAENVPGGGFAQCYDRRRRDKFSRGPEGRGRANGNVLQVSESRHDVGWSARRNVFTPPPDR